MSDDKAKHNILPPTKFGLIQITRQRVRPALTIDTKEKCPMCSGDGKIDSSLSLIDQIENKIANLTVIKSNKIKILLTLLWQVILTKDGFFLQ